MLINIFGYFQFFVSLQFWPVLFAILNAAMTMYGHSQSMEFGQITMVNIDKVDELHQDIAGVAGYMMLLIPFLANGLVSNLGAAFNGLATSMTGHLQGSAMSLAGEAASGSFGLGQTSFYNTSANNFSANKHDSNWSHLHGMHTEQLSSGVLKTITGQGGTVFDVGPGMSRNAVSINSSEALSGSLNQAYESSQQAAQNESQHFQSSLSNFAHRAVQLSEVAGHDLRLGDGVSSSESGQYSKALSTMGSIASDVAHRLGVSQDEAMQRLTSAGIGVHAGASSDRSILGVIANKTIGWSGGGDIHTKTDRTSTSGDRFHEGTDTGISARQAQDFHQAFNYVSHFAQTHHFDDSHSEAASLSNQMGADLREAETASHNYDASMTRSERIHQAKSYVESNSAQINTDLNQAFPAFVASKVGETTRDQLFASPGDTASLHKLEALGNEFVGHKRDELIAEYGSKNQAGQVDSFYQNNSGGVVARSQDVGSTYKKNSEAIELGAKGQDVGIDHAEANQFKHSAHNHIHESKDKAGQGGDLIEEARQKLVAESNQDIEKGEYNAKRNAVFPHPTRKE